MSVVHPPAHTSEQPTEPVRHVDGNAIAGLLADVFTGDASLLVLACRQCGRVGPLGATDVEDDAVAAIVRCRGCTRTLLTVMRTDTGVSVSLGNLDRIEVRAGRP